METETVTEGTTPVVTPQTKFRKGGFTTAAQVAAKAEAAGETPPADPVEAAAEADTTGVEMSDEFNLPGTPDEEPEVQAAAEEEPEGDIRIGDKTFKTQKEAWSYAEELERERLAADAFRQGVEAASAGQNGNQVTVTPPAPPVEEEIPVDIMYDPKRLAKYIADKAETAATKARDAERAVSARQTKHDQTWNQFYSDYPDLQGEEDIVQMRLQAKWNEIGHLDVKPALKILAEDVRMRLNKTVEKRAPAKELPKVKTTASAGGGGKVTTPKSTEKALDFVSQMRKLKADKQKKGGRA